ncbi:MAG: hypothetical protein Kow0032_07200 [Methyloligellaceae bacterium]
MKFRALALMILIGASSGGCATATGDFCDIAFPIRPAANDQIGRGTAEQIVRHNERGELLCGWQP